jgi:UDP-N-acetylglucosamine 2-epimerase
MYANQLLNIRILSATLPPGWFLYVKDHPHQHNIVHMSYSVEKYLVDLKYYRDINFYSYIASLDNVRLIDHSVRQADLVRHSRAVASITGSVFAEASYLSQPILVIGHKTPYRRLSNAFGVSDVASCKKAIVSIMEAKASWESDMEAFLHDAVILANIHQLEEKDRVEIADFILRLLRYISAQ